MRFAYYARQSLRLTNKGPIASVRALPPLPIGRAAIGGSTQRSTVMPSSIVLLAIFSAIGGGGTLDKSLRSLAASGQVSAVGWLANEISTISISSIAGMVGTVRRIAVGSRSQFIDMLRAVDLHELQPVIDRVFPFREAVDAFRYYAGRCFGKVVITLDEQ